MTKPVHEFDMTIVQKDGYLFDVTFDDEKHAHVQIDEPPPLGEDRAPNAVRYLAAAVGNCLSASLVFCASRKLKVAVNGLETKVHVEITRDEQRRLRVGRIEVNLELPEGRSKAELEGCMELFESFCTVTESVRAGIQVDVHVNDAPA
ncbi:MAG: OsmC family protein [Deltaproteobacteria bacterium]|nr:OsmC family protein [Deltaproteobacteria bacterium]